VRDDENKRSTRDVLEKLRNNGSLDDEQHRLLLEGYSFLSELDHNIRLTVGRSTRFPAGQEKILEIIANRMRIANRKDLIERLNIARLYVRSAFLSILGDDA
jgi:glutamine synthetase adenylyltransferase